MGIRSEGTLENNWVHPPYALIGRVIRHIRQSNALATFIAPKWSSAYWWPLLAPHLKTSRYLELGSCGDSEFLTYLLMVLVQKGSLSYVSLTFESLLYTARDSQQKDSVVARRKLR